MKLSKTQQECLDYLKEHDTFLYFVPYHGVLTPIPYYFADKGMKKFREKTVVSLIKKSKQLEIFDVTKRDHKVRIKEKKQ